MSRGARRIDATEITFYLEVFMLKCKRGSFLFFYQLVSTCGDRPSSTAFLFSLVNKPGLGPFRLPARQSSYQTATYSCSSYGPTFGAGRDIVIFSEASSNENSYSNVGATYELPSGYSYNTEQAHSLLAGSYQFKPNEVEVFYETN